IITYDTEYYDAESSIYSATSLSMENASSNIYGSGKGTDNYTDVGVYRMTITGTGNFTGTVPTQYEIVADAKNLKKVRVTGFVSKVPYSSDDDAMLQNELVLNDGETTLEEGNAYILKYSNSDAIGKATLEIFGTGQYIGHIKKTYQITGTALSKAKILGLEKSLPFTGKAVSQKNISLRLVNKGQSDTVLTSGKDYTVSYKNNIKAGTATVIFTGKGYYFGTVKKSFKITPIDIAADSKKKYPNVVVSTEDSAVIQKGGAKPAVTVTYRGLILKEGVDYKLSYKNNTKPGTADSGAKAPSVTVNFKGNYKGTITKQFTAVN
ncbi:MAG: hypothetical protein K6E33_03285, partial [Lachnospiraceae bacterium]|nr:hypothetical protein [Lachnospiraceae bacterium]